MNESISVQFISNRDGGINDTSSYRDGITLGELIDLKEGGHANGYTVRLNRKTVTDLDVELEDGDVVSIAPTNIKGA